MQTPLAVQARQSLKPICSPLHPGRRGRRGPQAMQRNPAPGFSAAVVSRSALAAGLGRRFIPLIRDIPSDGFMSSTPKGVPTEPRGPTGAWIRKTKITANRPDILHRMAAKVFRSSFSPSCGGSPRVLPGSARDVGQGKARFSRRP